MTIFLNTINNEFMFMVSPILFNITLSLKCEGNSCKMVKIYGINNDDDNILNNGEITKIKTLFLSNNNPENETKGGIIILML